MPTAHTYELRLHWTGNQGVGTRGYRDYERAHEVTAAGKAPIAGSSDPAFRGDAQRWSPEELLVASLSQCHMLWYLHLAATAGVVVTDYRDHPLGTMTEDSDGAGRFDRVLLRPRVTVADGGMRDRAQALHADANGMCFIARSVNFPVDHESTTEVAWTAQP